MHAVINHLPVKRDTDWDDFAAKLRLVEGRIDDPDFCGAILIRAGEAEAALIVLYRTEEALARISKDIAAPWFAEHIRQYVDGQPSRITGEILAGSLHP